MEFSEYLPDEAAKHRLLGEKDRRSDDQTGALQPECGEVGDRIDDHAIQNESHDTLISTGLTWGPRRLRARSTAASSSYRQHGRTVTRRGLGTGEGEIRGKQN
jgi:hypothetical protein